MTKKTNEDKAKEAAANEEARKKQEAAAAEAKKVYVEKYGTVMAAKAKRTSGQQKQKQPKSATGLETLILKPGSGKKPADGTTFYIHYAGYLEDGSLFDSSYEDVSKKLREVRPEQGYTRRIQSVSFSGRQKKTD